MKKRLYCIPGGGTTSILFIQWQKHFGSDMKVEYLDIPGRGYLSKKAEQPDMQGIARSLAEEIMRKSADEPYSVFGYCFGAVAAYAVCLELEKDRFHAPDHVYLCGSYSPSPKEPVIAMVGRRQIRDEMKKMFYHMFPQYLFKDTQMQKTVCSKYMEILYDVYDATGAVLPVDPENNSFAQLMEIDADTTKHVIRLANTYFGEYGKDEKIFISYCNSKKPEKKIAAPFTVIYGRDDNIIKDEWKNWENFTTCGIESVSIPCDHFSLTDDMAQIVKIINKSERSE